MSEITRHTELPDKNGRFGQFGGRFVSEVAFVMFQDVLLSFQVEKVLQSHRQGP